MTAIITNIGLSIIANRLEGVGTEPIYFGWGTGTTAPTSADTALQIEDATGGYSRVAGTSAIITVSVASDTFQVSGSMTALAGLVITEWGLFDAITTGNMLMREVQNPGLTLTLGGILNFILKHQFSRCEA
jgi:hypothetical protein